MKYEDYEQAMEDISFPWIKWIINKLKEADER